MDTENYIRCEVCEEDYPVCCPSCPECGMDEYVYPDISTSAAFIEAVGSLEEAIEYKDPYGKRILTMVVGGELLDEVRFWVARSEINEQDYFGDTPLEMALQNERYKIARFLIRNGADCSPYVGDNLERFQIIHYMYPEKKRNKERRKTRKCIEKYTAGVGIKPAKNKPT